MHVAAPAVWSEWQPISVAFATALCDLKSPGKDASRDYGCILHNKCREDVI